jgi:hypothetical protein
MKQDPFIPALAGCEEFQFQLSELADAGAAPTPELLAHIQTCDECARFAETWLPGPPEALSQSVGGLPDVGLRERILDAATAPNVVAFPVPATGGRQPWVAWLGRVAACAALVGFSYWLLNPMRSQPGKRATVTPTVAQGLSEMENRSKREQQAVQTALVDGGREVQGNLAWSASALDL